MDKEYYYFLSYHGLINFRTCLTFANWGCCCCSNL